MSSKSMSIINGAQNLETKEKKLLKPKNDLVFQSLFSKENVNITKDFAECLLERKINKIKINDDKEISRQNPDDKLGILDLQLDIDDNEKVDVEVQLIDKHNFIERLIYYLSRMYSSTVKIGQEYETAKRVVLIAILDYNLEITKFTEEMQTQWMLRETKNHQKVLTNKIEVDIIELSKVKKEYEKNKNNKKAQWMLFLDDPNSKEVQEIMKENKKIEEAVVTVHKMSEDEKIRRLAYLREKAIRDEKAIYAAGIDKGIARGKVEGAAETKVSIVLKLSEMNMQIEQIAEATNLSVEKVNSIIDENK